MSPHSSGFVRIACFRLASSTVAFERSTLTTFSLVVYCWLCLRKLVWVAIVVLLWYYYNNICLYGLQNFESSLRNWESWKELATEGLSSFLMYLCTPIFKLKWSQWIWSGRFVGIGSMYWDLLDRSMLSSGKLLRSSTDTEPRSWNQWCCSCFSSAESLRASELILLDMLPCREWHKLEPVQEGN